MYQHILVPLDGSEVAEAILTHIAAIIDAHAEVTLLTVLDGQSDKVLPPGPVTLAHRAQQYLLGVAAELGTRGIQTRVLVREGKPAEVIVAAVTADDGVEVVAMASHGHGGVKRLLRGSVTEQVMRTCPVPVLVVRSYEPAGEGRERVPLRNIQLRNVLVPLDGSTAAEDALEHAVWLAEVHQATLHLLWVVSPKASAEGVDTARAELDALVQPGRPLHDTDLQVRAKVLQGRPFDEITRYVAEQSVDLVTMATRGRTGASRIVKGSLTESMLRSLDIPILVRRIVT